MYNVCVSGKWDDGVENFWNNKKKECWKFNGYVSGLQQGIKNL